MIITEIEAGSAAYEAIASVIASGRKLRIASYAAPDSTIALTEVLVKAGEGMWTAPISTVRGLSTEQVRAAVNL